MVWSVPVPPRRNPRGLTLGGFDFFAVCRPAPAGAGRQEPSVYALAGSGDTVVVMLTAIITLSPDACTLGAVRAFLRDAARYSVPASTPLIDGGHAAPAAFPERTVATYGTDLAAVSAMAASVTDLSDDAEVVFASDVALDLPVFSVEPIVCGDHIGSGPENVIVTVNPACEGHDA